MKKLIIFDMDGTLIDSGDVITNTINFVRENLGMGKIDKNTMLTQLNNPDINSSEFFYGTSEFTDKQTKLFTEYYDENCVKDIVLYEGIKELLEVLSQEYILSIATNASSPFAIKMLKVLDIEHHFSLIVGADMVDKPKPHSDMLLHTLDKFNILKEDAILIGDSHKDSRSAINADMNFILVNWGFSSHADGAVSNTIDLKEKIKISLEDR
ncbi:MAG: HAD family hydrolase [Arcobacteraceae bacterium]|nr:HAD family hydrolase [Arcobacteraceae bacterium]